MKRKPPIRATKQHSHEFNPITPVVVRYGVGRIPVAGFQVPCSVCGTHKVFLPFFIPNMN